MLAGYRMENDNDWDRWSNLVLEKIKEFGNQIESVNSEMKRMNDRLYEIERKVAILEARILIYAGVFAVLVNGAIMLILKYV